jgi:LPXTG-motif cell wall-anchored protein
MDPIMWVLLVGGAVGAGAAYYSWKRRSAKK